MDISNRIQASNFGSFKEPLMWEDKKFLSIAMQFEESKINLNN